MERGRTTKGQVWVNYACSRMFNQRYRDMKYFAKVLFVLLILVGLMLMGAEPVGAAQLLGIVLLCAAYAVHELFRLSR